MPSLNRVHLNGLRAVEAVARGGSLKAAALELGVSAGAVSQQVTRSEAQLGRALFARTPAGLKLTRFGQEVTMRLGAGFRELEAAVALASRAETHTLVVSVAPAFASRWMLPRLMRHFERHPDVTLRIDASIGLVDLDHSDVDVAIRLGDGHWPNARVESLLPMEIFPVCAPSMAKHLRSIDDLAEAWEIADVKSMIAWDTWFAAARHEPVAMKQGARFNDPMLCIDAVIAAMA